MVTFTPQTLALNLSSYSSLINSFAVNVSFNIPSISPDTINSMVSAFGSTMLDATTVT
jgi:hypothetical protein